MPDLNSLPPSARSPPTFTAPSFSSSSAFPIQSQTSSSSSSSFAPRLATPALSGMSSNSHHHHHSSSGSGSGPGIGDESAVVPSTSPSRPSPSPSRTASTSLQAAAAVNAGLQHEGSRRTSGSLSRQVTTSSNSGRRRSQVLMNLQLNDPSVPGPGEMVHEHRGSSNMTSPIAPSNSSPLLMARDPHHNRAPSLGELHQELEAEQEAQVNRLLFQIRQQQAQIMQLQQNHSAIAGDESPGHVTPAPSSMSASQTIPPSAAHPVAPSAAGSLPRSPVYPRSSFDLVRHRSRTPSRGASPRLRSTSISQESGEPFTLAGRDESAFYLAETQMLVRENQMLRHRIRELERQLELGGGGGGGSATASVTREPAHHSGLTRSESVSEETRPSGSEVNLPIRELPKEE